MSNKINIMEVCGTHTMEIGKNGIRELFKDRINLISGPGCPICVTPMEYIDYIYNISLKEEVIIATYGDLMRIPGSLPEINMKQAKSKGADIRVILSITEVIEIAKENLDKRIVFISLGFETTTPISAVLLEEAKKNKFKNIQLLVANKSIIPAMKLLVEDKSLNIDGFLCPGNVAVIIGTDEFEFLNSSKSKGVIAGFKRSEIIEALEELMKIQRGVVNKYKSFVDRKGNSIAKEMIKKYFYLSDGIWRGLGVIGESSYKLRDEFKEYDIFNYYPLKKYKYNGEKKKEENCKCGSILKGVLTPADCPNFKRVCTPEFPIGPCMVSKEGTCASYYLNS